MRVGERVAENAVWGYPEPIEDAPPLAGYVAFYWDKMDEWLEEDEPAIVHARDPYHRVDVLDTSRHVRVLGQRRAGRRHDARKVLFETGPAAALVHPARGRAHRGAGRERQRTGCAYKGFASYWSVKVGGELEEDLVWLYREPRREVEPINGPPGVLQRARRPRGRRRAAGTAGHAVEP